MATISSKDTIKTMLDNDGVYPGDPQASSIWEYVHALTGRVCWAVFSDERHNDLAWSPYVAEYRLLWDRVVGHSNSLGCLEKGGEAGG